MFAPGPAHTSDPPGFSPLSLTPTLLTTDPSHAFRLATQVSLKPFHPPDTRHGYVFTFWGRAAPSKAGQRSIPKVDGRRAPHWIRWLPRPCSSAHHVPPLVVGLPSCAVSALCIFPWPRPRLLLAWQVVFQDADDLYTPIKQVPIPLSNEWQMYEVDFSVPAHRQVRAQAQCGQRPAISSEY